MKTRARLLPIFLALACAFMATGALRAQRIMATIAANAPVTIVPEPGRTPLATLPEGTQVEVLGPEEDGWYKIAFRDNYLLGDRVGYVRAEHLRVPSATPTRTGPQPPKAAGSTPASSRPENGATASGFAASHRGSRGNLSESSIAEAIVAGRIKKDTPGLRLLENGQPGRPSNGTNSSRFRLQIYTPLAWISQLAADAAADSRAFGVDDVTDDMTEPVLRVTAYSGAMSPASRNRTCWVRHVVLRSASKDTIVQPLSRTSVSEHVVSSAGGSAVFEGLRLTFPMEAVRRLRGASGDGEFIIAVIGVNGEEKDLRITREYLRQLPM